MQMSINKEHVWLRLTSGPNASRGVSIPEFLRKPIATCDFPGEGGPGRGSGPPAPPPLDLCMNKQASRL